MVYLRPVEENYLEHHGIKGQKWGVRRYQNSDGSWTAAGRKRYRAGGALDSNKPSVDEMQNYIKQRSVEKTYNKLKKEEDNSGVESAKRLANSVSDGANAAKNIYKSFKKESPTGIDVDEMTNKELQDAITRMNLEDNYIRLMRSRDPAMKQGTDYVEKILGTTSEIAKLSVTAIALYSALKNTGILKQSGLDGVYFKHHGIPGQKWGVKNGPPYPLSAEAHSREEKIASGNSEVGMSDFTAQALAELATIAVIATAKVVSQNVADNKRRKQYIEEYYGQREINSLKEAKRIDPASMSMDEHMATINPDYPQPGSTENCMFCTTAMAMRMKGYDVKANACPSGWTYKNLKDNFEGATLEKPKCRNTSQLNNYLSKQGDGAYGNLMVFGKYGGGHSVFYHVENGKTMIYDCQSNDKYPVRLMSSVVNLPDTQVIRLDNLTPSEYVLGALKK